MLAKKCFLLGIFTLLSISLAISAQPVHPTTGEPLVIDCLRGTPDAIDGDLSDWNLEAMTPAVLDAVEQLYFGQETWTGPEDCSGKFYLLWDDVNIYMAVVVKDEKLSMNKTGGDIWNADAVEILFATTDARADHSWSNPTIHYQYGFNANNQKWNWCNMDGPGQSEPDYLQIASSVTADGYICEASIEYGQMLSLDFSAGNTIGFHAVLDDTDNSDAELQMTWTGLAAHDQGMGYGHMLLSADSVPALEEVEKTVLFAEDFEGLPLGPNVDEALAGDAVWTDTPPEGWTVDESGIPGIGMDATDGVTEWAGWAFADKAWWVEAAEDQDRSLFELGTGIVAVADPDEWDDAERLPIPIEADPYDTWLTTPEIKISSAEAGTLELKFDSSWRPEFDDDYHQTASITASYDGAEPVVVLLWESDEASLNYHPYATNETVVVKLGNPEGAKKVVLTFGLYDAGNDWWWAIDNVEVRGVVPSVVPVNPGTNSLLAYYPLDGDANDISGNGINGTIFNADTGGLGEGGSVWVDDPERGTVISFNGTASGAYVRAGEIPQMTLTNDFTWSFWAKQKAENTTTNDIILGNRKDENAVDFVPRQFIKFTPTKFEWHMNGNGNDNMEYDDIPADVWLHHAVVKTGDQLTYYRNGIEAGSGTITQALDVPQPLFFGGDNEGAEGENWNGLMSDVCIYDRALSEAEILYLAGERATDPSLVIYYSFDEVGDIVADQSGKGHDGVVVGDVTAEANGMYGGAANLANTGYLDLDGANFPAEDIPTSGFTLAAWTNIDGTSNQNAIFNARASDSTWLIHPEIRPGNGDYRFTVRKYGGVTIGNINGDTPGYKKPEGTPVPNEWIHVAMTFSRVDAQVILYVNGEVVAEAAITEDADMAGDWGLGARVGYNIDDARHYTGLMDEFRMYTRALSQDEILGIMQGP